MEKFYKTLESPDHFYVYPRVVDETRLEIPLSENNGKCAVRKNLYEDPFEFRGIREYQPTDPMHKINWKVSARTDQWMVNLYDSTSAQEVVVLLDVEDETIWKFDAIHEEGIRLQRPGFPSVAEWNSCGDPYQWTRSEDKSMFQPGTGYRTTAGACVV